MTMAVPAARAAKTVALRVMLLLAVITLYSSSPSLPRSCRFRTADAYSPVPIPLDAEPTANLQRILLAAAGRNAVTPQRQRPSSALPRSSSSHGVTSAVSTRSQQHGLSHRTQSSPQIAMDQVLFKKSGNSNQRLDAGPARPASAQASLQHHTQRQQHSPQNVQSPHRQRSPPHQQQQYQQYHHASPAQGSKGRPSSATPLASSGTCGRINCKNMCSLTHRSPPPSYLGFGLPFAPSFFTPVPLFHPTPSCSSRGFCGPCRNGVPHTCCVLELPQRCCRHRTPASTSSPAPTTACTAPR